MVMWGDLSKEFLALANIGDMFLVEGILDVRYPDAYPVFECNVKAFLKTSKSEFVQETAYQQELSRKIARRRD